MRVLLAALVLLVPALALASPADKKAAATTYKVLFPKESYPAFVDQVLGMMLEASLKEGRPFPPGHEPELRRAIAQAVPYDDVVDAAATSMAEHFTAEEIADIDAFARKPVARKFFDFRGVLDREATPKLQALASARITPILQKQALLPQPMPKK